MGGKVILIFQQYMWKGDPYFPTLRLIQEISFSTCDQDEKDTIVRCCFPQKMNYIQQKYFDKLLYDSEVPVNNFIAKSFLEAGKVGCTVSNSVRKYSNNEAMFHILLA